MTPPHCHPRHRRITWLDDTVAADNEFALCLTHDVDRPYKTYQTVYYALAERDPGHLLDLVPGRNPYWTFDEILRLERDLGVRSSWYFLDEQRLFRDRPPRDWLDPTAWKLYAGRYAVDDPAIRDLIHRLDAGGWEIGLHGSYESYRDADLLAAEKQRLERVLGESVPGVRQHYLQVERPQTWDRQRAAGLSYDASLWSGEIGFTDGHEPLRPFDDSFVVFPVTIMEQALPDPGTTFDEAWATCERLLLEARENTAAMSVLWHPRYFSDDFPGYTELYRRLVERARELGAWIGPAGRLYESMSHSGGERAVSTGPSDRSVDSTDSRSV